MRRGKRGMGLYDNRPDANQKRNGPLLVRPLVYVEPTTIQENVKIVNRQGEKSHLNMQNLKQSSPQRNQLNGTIRSVGREKRREEDDCLVMWDLITATSHKAAYTQLYRIRESNRSENGVLGER